LGSEVLDYWLNLPVWGFTFSEGVIVHELLQLHYPNHGKMFGVLLKTRSVLNKISGYGFGYGGALSQTQFTTRGRIRI